MKIKKRKDEIILHLSKEEISYKLWMIIWTKFLKKIYLKESNHKDNIKWKYNFEKLIPRKFDFLGILLFLYFY
ncbi:MAG: hypothetical protein HYW78_04830 [Parcubacteria group bacterium]|nr:hypothetical protein [Parcubacteria group bacterium]